MDRLRAGEFSKALGNLRSALDQGRLLFAAGQTDLDGDVRALLRSSIEYLRGPCFIAAMDALGERGEDILRRIDEDAFTTREVLAVCEMFHQDILRTLTERLVYQIHPADMSYFLGDHFEVPLRTAFPDAVYDMNEAGKCYALDRFTATVFHLMRVIEVGINAFHAHAEAAPPKNPNWELTLKACENVGADPAIVAHLRAIKNAWRNPSMHVERQYGRVEADEILTATSAFMRHLSNRIRPAATVPRAPPPPALPRS